MTLCPMGERLRVGLESLLLYAIKDIKYRRGVGLERTFGDPGNLNFIGSMLQV